MSCGRSQLRYLKTVQVASSVMPMELAQPPAAAGLAVRVGDAEREVAARAVASLHSTMLFAGLLLPSAPPCDQTTAGIGAGAPSGWRIRKRTSR